MHVRTFDDQGWFVVLDRGEEIVASIVEFASREGIGAALVSGIGAVSEVELGFFDPGTDLYEREKFIEPMEIGSMVGNISLVHQTAEARAPFLHAHMTLGRRDFSTLTGHLFSGVIGVTGEFAIRRLPGTLRRVPSDEFSLNLLDLGES